MNQPELRTSVIINSSLAEVWESLTQPDQMKQWMSESDIKVTTDWAPGHVFRIEGELHGAAFVNTGTVLRFEKEKVLSYSHLSSISGLPNKIENYTIFEFNLVLQAHQAFLTFYARVFPTETIYKHLAFYWPVALEELKKFTEKKHAGKAR